MTCSECGGKGSYGKTVPAHEFPRSDGTVFVSGPTYSTHLCACRVALPPREGKAAWWTSEGIFSETIDVAIFDESVEVAVRAEVPISDDNYRVHRRGNRYYPTNVDLEVGNETRTLWPAEARQLAAALIRAADAAETIDTLDTDTCGHWAPCGCVKAQAANAGATPVPEGATESAQKSSSVIR